MAGVTRQTLQAQEKERTELMKVFIIGATGGVGVLTANALATCGDEVTGMHRRAEQAPAITETGASAVQGDLLEDTAEDLAAKMDGHDAVVFTAGADGGGSEQTTLIDGKGLEKAAEAAAQAGVAQFLLVSAFPDSERTTGLGEDFENYIRVKKGAEIALTRTSLDWIILRPGQLRDEPGNGKITAGPALFEVPIQRENVAAFIAEVLHSEEFSRLIVEVVDGPTPVVEAVAAAAEATGPRRTQ